MNRLGVARPRVALMRLRRFFTYCRSLSGCARTMSTLHRGVGLFTISKREKDRVMECCVCGRVPGNDTLEAQILFSRHELACLEAESARIDTILRANNI